MKTKDIPIAVGMNVLFMLTITFNQQLLSRGSTSKEVTQTFENEGKVTAINSDTITVETTYICFFGCDPVTEEKTITRKELVRILT